MENHTLSLFKKVESGKLSAEEAYVELVVEFAAKNIELLGGITPEIRKISKLKNDLELSVGDKIKRIKPIKFVGTGRKQNMTVGKVYEILDIKSNYSYHKIAVAIRCDDGLKRWYSYYSIIKNCELVK